MKSAEVNQFICDIVREVSDFRAFPFEIALMLGHTTIDKRPSA